MITRKSTVSLKFSNTGKQQSLLTIMEMYAQDVNFFINHFWANWRKYENLKYASKEIYSLSTSTLSAALKQRAAMQALKLVRSTLRSRRAKNSKARQAPVFKGFELELTVASAKLKHSKNSFDYWLHLCSLGGLILDIPIKLHKHFKKFKDWKRKKTITISKDHKNNLYATFFFEKEDVPKKLHGNAIGIDQGYKKLAFTSDNQVIGQELPVVIENITRKVRGSKNYQRAIRRKENYINKEIKKLRLDEVKDVVLENLKNIKQKSKLSRKVNNKLQYWARHQFETRLGQLCELSGVHIHKVNPKNTSRRCSVCGFTHKGNRKGEVFLCLDCGHLEDADYNASKNILMRFTSKV